MRIFRDHPEAWMGYWIHREATKDKLQAYQLALTEMSQSLPTMAGLSDQQG